MTDRYSIRGQDDYWAVSDDCGQWNVVNGIRTRTEAKILCDEMNKLENENRRLEKFKDDVFAKIDMHLRMLPTARDNEFKEEFGDPSLYTGAIYMLETLKKELQE